MVTRGHWQRQSKIFNVARTANYL